MTILKSFESSSNLDQAESHSSIRLEMVINQRHLVHKYKLVKNVISGRFQFDTFFSN